MLYTPLPQSMMDDHTRSLLQSPDHPYSPTFHKESKMERRRIIKAMFFIVIAAGFLLCFLGYRRYSPSFNAATAAPSPILSTKTVRESALPLNYTADYDSVPINNTLGFQKVYVLNLASRVDKRDELALMAYSSGIHLDFIDAVTKPEVQQMTIVDHPADMLVTLQASYRTHINALRKVVEDDVETALILEDDVDWDVDVKKAFESIQNPLATLIGSMKRDGVPRGPTSSAPYGEHDWDVIYFGACLESSWVVKKEERKNVTLVGDERIVDYDAPPYIVYEDNTAPDSTEVGEAVKKMFKDYKLELATPGSDFTTRRRVLQRARGPICTDSYAVTRRGAAKLLYHLTRSLNAPIDLGMAWASGDGRVETYTVFPPIMDQWRIYGSSKNSDINVAPPAAKKREATKRLDKRSIPDVGISLHMHNSIRKHLKKEFSPLHTAL